MSDAAPDSSLKQPTADTDRLFGMNPSRVIEIGLIALTICVYGQVCTFGQIMFDDPIFVSSNMRVTNGLTLEGIGWAFRTYYFANWIPLTWLSFMLDASLFDDWWGGFHVTNALLHLANVLLLFHFLKQATGRRWPSAFVAALFAVQPIHVESVAWISERRDVLSICFGLLSLNFYVSYARSRSVRSYVAALCFFLASLLAKSTLVTLPFVLLLLDYWPLDRLRSKRPWALIAEKLPYFVMAIAISIVTVIAQREGFSDFQLQGGPLPYRVANALIAYVLYVGKALVPFHLGVFYPYPADNISLVEVAFATAVLGGITYVVARSWRAYPFLLVGWFWYLGTLVPMSGIVHVGRQQMADRYAYFPFIGLYIAIAWMVPVLVKSSRVRVVLATIVLTFYTVTGFLQARYWHDGLTLMRHSLSVARDDWFLHFNLGAELYAAGLITEAFDELERGVHASPHDHEAYMRLGELLAREHRNKEALHAYQQALAIDEDSVPALNYLGQLYLAMNNYPAAKRTFLRSLDTQKGVPSTYYYLAYVTNLMGQFAESNRYCEQGLVLDPDFDACDALRARNNAALAQQR